jgi:hypothetical protein
MAVRKITIRRGTASSWTSANPTLSSGEMGFETDTGKFKIGTGVLAWTSLGYSNANLANASVDALSDVTVTSPSNGQVLKWNGSAWINATDNAGTTIASIDDISDVSINTFSLAAEDILEWNGSAWVNTNRLSTFGFAQLADYNNPVFGPPADGDVLTYNTSNYKWEPVQPTGGVATSSTPHPFAFLG